jgi:hypothetical protein
MITEEEMYNLIYKKPKPPKTIKKSKPKSDMKIERKIVSFISRFSRREFKVIIPPLKPLIKRKIKSVKSMAFIIDSLPTRLKRPFYYEFEKHIIHKMKQNGEISKIMTVLTKRQKKRLLKKLYNSYL